MILKDWLKELSTTVWIGEKNTQNTRELYRIDARAQRVKKEGVGFVVSGSLSAEDLFESGEGMEPIKREIAQILERLSNMLNSGFDEEVYQEAKKIAEQTGEEHLKDMLRIVEKRLRRTKGTEKEIKIRIIK